MFPIWKKKLSCLINDRQWKNERRKSAVRYLPKDDIISIQFVSSARCDSCLESLDIFHGKLTPIMLVLTETFD